MKSISILMGFLAVMAGATTPRVEPYTRSSNYVLRCTSSIRLTACTTDGRTTSCDANGRLTTSDRESCGSGWCRCVDLRLVDSDSSSFQDINIVRRQVLLGDVGHAFFKQGFYS
ncbi:hypothetical protein CIB48_g9391 [Xylaria polymorpha]|nr:hypothetical protein CIB48_g9391 [Xylaria polymorpha]